MKLRSRRWIDGAAVEDVPTQHHDLQALLEWATDHGYFDGNVIGDVMAAATEAEHTVRTFSRFRCPTDMA
jgi:hypothetical protein